MNKFSQNTDKDFMNALCERVKAISPAITRDERARKVSFNTPSGRPKKFAEIKSGGALTLRLYSQKEKERIYPEGTLEIKTNRKIETYKKLHPGDNCDDAVRLAEKAFRMSQDI